MVNVCTYCRESAVYQTYDGVVLRDIQITRKTKDLKMAVINKIMPSLKTMSEEKNTSYLTFKAKLHIGTFSVTNLLFRFVLKMSVT